MKFLHTADWQIGMRAAHVGSAAKAVRQERLAAAKRVVDRAIEHGAEFILIAGDTFENNAVDRLLVQKIADILGAFHAGKVFLLPGNHDPLCAGSIWDHPAWGLHANLHILRDSNPIDIPGGMLWGCPLREKHGRRDPTSCIDSARTPDQGIRIGIAHGSIEGIPTDEPYFPIPRNVASVRSLDYLALGHWHSHATFDNCPRLAYSGTHEQTKFGERDSGNALLVEIDSPGASPRVTPIRTGRLIWEAWDITCSAPGDLARVLAGLESVADADAMLLHLTIGGILLPAEQHVLERLREVALSRLLHHRIDDSGLRPLPDDASWLTRLPPGAVREAAERLHRWSDPACTGDDRPANATPCAASRALIELFALSAAAGATS